MSAYANSLVKRDPVKVQKVIGTFRSFARGICKIGFQSRDNVEVSASKRALAYGSFEGIDLG